MLPLVAVVWGAAVIVFGISKGVSGSASYAAGSIVGLLFGVALVVVGVRSLIKRTSTSY